MHTENYTSFVCLSSTEGRFPTNQTVLYTEDIATAIHLIQKMENVLLVMFIRTIGLLYLGPMLVKETGEN